MNKVRYCAAVLALAGLLAGCQTAAETPRETEQALEAAEMTTEEAPPVHTDWSALEPQTPEPAAETPHSVGALEPRDDYGPLLPYVGVANYLGGSEALPLYGLATEDGQAATDPIYASVSSLGPYLLLTQADSLGYARDSTGIRYLEGTYRMTAAAADGRWVLDAGDWDHYFLVDTELVAARQDGSVLVLSPDGTVKAEFSRADLTPWLGEDYAWGGQKAGLSDGGEVVYAGGPLAVCRYDENSPYGNFWSYDCFLYPETGEVSGEPPAGWDPDEGWGGWEESLEIPGYLYPGRLEDIVTGEVYYCGCREDASSPAEDLMDAAGRLLLRACFTPSSLQWEPVIADGMLGIVKDGAFTYTDIATGDLVFRYPLRSNAD